MKPSQKGSSTGWECMKEEVEERESGHGFPGLLILLSVLRSLPCVLVFFVFVFLLLLFP